jgi:DNA-binding MarR family transcriptional regulator
MSASQADRDASGPRLDPEWNAGFLLVSIANRISASGSRTYMRHFGVGVMEWRVLAMLALKPGITANQIGQVSAVDKSSVSRATASLLKRGYVRSSEDPADSRRLMLYLTPSGQALHDRIIVASLAREELLLDGLSAKERETFFRLLHRVGSNTALLNAYDPSAP